MPVHKFKKGQSGNPAGRPKGATNKLIELRAMLKPYTPALIQKVVELALSGDTSALKICIDRIIPVLKPSADPVAIGLPEGTLSQQAAFITKEAAGGELLLSEANEFMGLITSQIRIQELTDISERLAALEAAAITQGGHNGRN